MADNRSRQWVGGRVGMTVMIMLLVIVAQCAGRDIKRLSAMQAAAKLDSKPILEGEEAGHEEGHGLAVEDKDDDVGTWDPVAAFGALNAYADAHPHFTSSAIAWIIAGNVLGLVGLFLVLFSEIRMVMTVRTQDTRKQLVELQHMVPTERLKEVAEEEKRSVAGRPYITALGSVLLVAGAACFLTPFCDILDIIGVSSGVPCAVIVLMEAVVFGVCVSCFLVALCWSCTRPWAAIVFMVISLMGDILCPTGNVLLVCVWFAFSVLLFGAYFYWLPASYADKEEEVPAWVQSVGPLDISLDPKRWHQAGESIGREATDLLINAGNNLQTLNPLAVKQKIVGKDGIEPVVGMRVRMAAQYTEKGIGTISQVHPSKKHCAVSWDLGGVENQLYTDGRAEYLVVVEPADTADKNV